MNRPDKSLASMLVSHEIDAASGAEAATREANFIDCSTGIHTAAGDWSKVKPLFPNLIAEGTRFYRKYGFYSSDPGNARGSDLKLDS
jgi:hypothetical protein